MGHKWTCDLVATMTMTPMMMMRKSKMMMQILIISKIIKMAHLSRLRSSTYNDDDDQVDQDDDGDR